MTSYGTRDIDLVSTEPIDTMRLGGFVLLALAALDIVEQLVLSFWFDFDISISGVARQVLPEVLLGVAMLQGNDTARRVVLWVVGLSLVLAPLLLVGLYLVGFGHFWPVVAAWVVMYIGVFVLNASTEARRGVVIAALPLIVLGWVGSLAASIFLVGGVDFSAMKAIVDWSSPRRTFEDADAGITMSVPSSWVVLRDGNPIADRDKPLLTLANRRILSVAQVVRAYSDADTLDSFLDSVAKPKAAKVTGFVALERSDVTVGGVPARRLNASWDKGGTGEMASVTAWQDADAFYALYVTVPRVLAGRLGSEVSTLEHSLALTQPWTTFARDTVPLIQRDCPILSDRAILSVAHAAHRESSGSEVYCREGYRLALRGQAALEAPLRQRLTTRMRSFFAALPPSSSGRFGAYVERLRTGQTTTPGEDKAMTEIIRRAASALAPDVQDDLRTLFATSIAVGQFSDSLDRR